MRASGGRVQVRLLFHLRPQRCPFDDFDTGTPGIGDVGEGAAVGSLANRLVKLDAFRLDLLHEGCVVLHVETDVVEHTPSSRRLLRVGLGEPELYPGEVHNRGAVAGPRLPTEGLRVPSL